jgi:Ca2+-binding EF-hand superfamily protein
MGLEPFLSDRIFYLIDEDNDGAISFEDFVRYISILLNGSGVEKALWSFKLLSSMQIYCNQIIKTRLKSKTLRI